MKFLSKVKNFDTAKKLIPIFVFTVSALLARFLIKPFVSGDDYQMVSMAVIVLVTLLLSPLALKVCYGKSNREEISPLVLPVLLSLLTPLLSNIYLSEYFTGKESYKIFVYLITFFVFIFSFFLCNFFKNQRSRK
ncbi:hypothetical protein [Neisseria dentiae]|uniref:hypothetical protein n=1 Tax=Neisseria dentiae TaxID=194197 RepID=UPI0035A11D7D